MSSNLFLTIPTRNIKRNKLRSFLLIAGVALTVSLQIGIAISVDSLLHDFVLSSRNKNYTDITIRGKNPLTIEEIDEQIIPIIESVDGLGRMSAVATVPLADIIQQQAEGKYLMIYGVRNTHPDLPNLILEEGKRSIKPGEIIISRTIADLLEVDINDDFTLQAVPSLGFYETDLKVSAIMPDDYPLGNYERTAFLLIDFDFLHTLFQNDSLIDYHVSVSVLNLVEVNDLATELSDLLPNYYVIREKHIDELKATGFVSYQTAMTLLIAASYLIEFLFITNVFAITMKERSKEFGCIRAIGTSNLQMTLLVLAETAFIGLIGSIIGAVIGIGLSLLLLYAFKYYLGFTTFSALLIQPITIIISMITGFTVTIISGIWPLIVALRLPIVQNIHSTKEAKLKKRRFLTWKTSVIFGLILVIAGLIISQVIGETEFLGFELLSPHSLVVILIFFGTIAIEIGLVALLPKVGVRLLINRTIATMLIGIKDIEREMQRSTITIFTAALSLSFILIVGTVAGGLFDAVPKYYNQNFGENTDLVIETWDHLEYPTNFTGELLSNFYWIDNASFIQEQRSFISNIGLNTYFFGINASSYDHFLIEFMLQPYPNASVVPIFETNIHNVILTDVLTERLGVGVGDVLEIQVDSETTEYIQIGGICSANPFIHGGEYIFIDYSLFQSVWNKTSSKWFMADIRGTEISNADAEKVLQLAYPNVKSVKTTYYYFTMIQNSLGTQGAFIHLIFIHSFFLSGLTQFISILITTLKLERDVAIMRSMGMSKGEVFRLFLSESGMLGFTGVFIGIFNSIIGSELLAWYISLSIPIEATISGLRETALFFLWIIISMLVTLGSTYIPSRRASQTNIIAAISGRHEEKAKIGLYKPKEMDVKALAEKLYGLEMETPVDVDESEMKALTPEIEMLQNEILYLSQDLDLSVSENIKWHDWYNKQFDEFNKGKIDNRRFKTILNRYKKFLKEKNQV
ncbi:MAG: ABC transporter permease [Candidatus Hodarchaeota archaeon]